MANTTIETKCWFCQTGQCEQWWNCRCLQPHALRSPEHLTTVTRRLAFQYEAFLFDFVPKLLLARFPPDHPVPEACILAESLFEDVMGSLEIWIRSCQGSNEVPDWSSFAWETFTELSRNKDLELLAQLQWLYHPDDSGVESLDILMAFESTGREGFVVRLRILLFIILNIFCRYTDCDPSKDSYIASADCVNQEIDESKHVGVLRHGDPHMLCSICYSDISPYSTIADATYARTICSHTFHVRCLRAWCAESMTCPSCRRCIGQAKSSDWYWGGGWQPFDLDDKEFGDYPGSTFKEVIWGNRRPSLELPLY